MLYDTALIGLSLKYSYSQTVARKEAYGAFIMELKS